MEWRYDIKIEIRKVLRCQISVSLLLMMSRMWRVTLGFTLGGTLPWVVGGGSWEIWTSGASEIKLGEFWWELWRFLQAKGDGSRIVENLPSRLKLHRSNGKSYKEWRWEDLTRTAHEFLQEDKEEKEDQQFYPHPRSNVSRTWIIKEWEGHN